MRRDADPRKMGHDVFGDKIVEYAQIQLYQPSDQFVVGLQKRQINTMQILELSNAEQRYDDWLKINNKKPDQVLLGIFNGRYGRIWLVFDSAGKYIDYFK